MKSFRAKSFSDRWRFRSPTGTMPATFRWTAWPLPRFAALTLAGLLTACATAPSSTSESTPRPAAGSAAQALNFQLANGVYRCEHGQNVEVRRDARDTKRIVLDWQGVSHTLQRQESASGLPRYEDRQSGLLWIDLPWKSMLIADHGGQRRASECKSASRRHAQPASG